MLEAAREFANSFIVIAGKAPTDGISLGYRVLSGFLRGQLISDLFGHLGFGRNSLPQWRIGFWNFLRGHFS